ncbi:MAG: hypothetical protein ABI723_26930 [Bacteroidia bacterium]
MRKQKGFSFDNTSLGYFDVKPCCSSKYFPRLTPPATPAPPPNAWLKKYFYK